MKNSTHKETTVLNSVADLTADITDAPKDLDVKKLRFLVASTLRRQQKEKQYTPKSLGQIKRLLPREYDDDLREILHSQIREVESSDIEKVQPLEVHRRDEREALLEGRMVDSLSGLMPSRRLGPFIVEGGSEVWFDFFFGVQRVMVIEAGAGVPALVLTQARKPKVVGGLTTIKLEEGTVWLRGDLIDSTLPAGSFVGIKISSGMVELSLAGTIQGNTVEVGSTLEGHIKLELVADKITPVAKGCSSSNTNIELPEELNIQFDSGTTHWKGSAGEAQAWDQTFNFPQSTDSLFFVEPLWTVILEYEVDPQQLKTGSIPKDLIDYDGEGKAQITRAGLGLPVVVPGSPAILGEATNSPGWWLKIADFTARWYEPDPRFHKINEAFVGISNRGTVIFSEHIPPMSTPVTHAYMLCSIADSDGHRIPWHQTYVQNFMLCHRCDVISGEHLLVTGQTNVQLNLPVQANGSPVITPTTQGALLLHRFGRRISVTLAAATSTDSDVKQLVLRNALVWTTRPVAIFMHGNLNHPQHIEKGAAHLLFGVHSWAPILPDPYVTNFHLRQPDIGKAKPIRAQLVANISWSSPDQVNISFQGQFGSPTSITGKATSPSDPKPMSSEQEGPDPGPSQVKLNQLSLDQETAEKWITAREEEQRTKQKRVKHAQDQNNKSLQIISDYLVKMLGSVPHILLLDVSTNQDLLGIAFGNLRRSQKSNSTSSQTPFIISQLEVHSQISNMRVVTLPQVQWEPVRTLDPDQDIFTLGWFPTPLASATDGGMTQLGARSQRLVPHIPEDALRGTVDVYADGTPVTFRTTLPFGLVAVVQLQPNEIAGRPADLYNLTQPEFPDEDSAGGLHITAVAEGGRPDLGGVSPEFEGWMLQLINGVDLASGNPLGLSVLGSTGDPDSDVETIFNNDMMANPRVPVTRFDLSGYGGSNFSDWNNPFSAFAEAAKVQFHVMIGRTSLEVIKVNSVLHPWGIRVTRSITVERRPGGGVIRRDSGWQSFTPGLFDYRYFDKDTDHIEVASYTFDAGLFKGLFNIRSIRPAPGSAVSHDGATLVPYYFDAELALENLAERTQAIGILGYLQTKPNGDPASEAALQHLVETQGPIGGPIDAWIDFGGSGLPFRARRIEVGLAFNGPDPIFVATVRGVPKLPKTGAWSVVARPVTNVPSGGGEAIPVSENKGVPLIRRYPIRYHRDTETVFNTPPLDGMTGDYRFADAIDLLVPTAPSKDYGLLQSTPTHAFLFPRPYVQSANPSQIRSDTSAALADVIARSTSKGAFPPPQNTIELTAASLHFDVGTGGSLALSIPIHIVSHPTPLRIAGSRGHGTSLFYNKATLSLELLADRWNAEFTGLEIWTDIIGLERITGAELRVVGSTYQRPQIAELKTLILQEIEEILQYIPLFGMRGVQGPLDLGASNAKHELKVEIKESVTIPKPEDFFPIEGLELKFYTKQSTGFDLKAGGIKASATFGAKLDGRVPLYTTGVATVFLIVTVKVEFSIASLTGVVTSEKLDLLAFVGVGVKGRIGPFSAYAFLGIGFVLVYSIVDDTTKYGGLVALEAGVDLTIVSIIIRAELQGLVYDDSGTTKCDYSGKVKLEVEIFLIFSISATYQVTETATM